MIKIDINDAAVIAVLDRAAAQFDKLSPLYKSIGEILLASTRKRFGEGEAPDGTKWAPKSPATLAAYQARKPRVHDTRPLFDATKRLSKEINVYPEDDEVSIGSNVIYGAMMQFGGTKAAYPHLWGNIPARPFIGLSPDDIVNIVAETEEFIARAFGEQR